MKTKKNCFSRALVLMMAFMLVFTMMPSGMFGAAETAYAGEEDNVKVIFTFDISSLATDDVLETLEIAQIPDITVDVAKGTTLKSALEMYVEDNPSGVYFKGLENAYITEINGIEGYNAEDNSKFSNLMASLGIGTIPTEFQYAGWMYSGDGLSGWGINTDTVQNEVTVNFRYTLYYGAKSETEWATFDWEFLDAYTLLTQKISEAQTIADCGYTGFSEAQKTVLDEKLQAAKNKKTTIDEETSGIWAYYFAEKRTGLWGPTSPTDEMQKAAEELSDAINKIPTPTSIEYVIKKDGVSYTSDNLPTFYVGDTVQIVPTVLPEGAPQDVSYEVFFGNAIVDADGKLTFTGTCTNAIVQVKSNKVSTVNKLIMGLKAIEPPTYTATFTAADGLTFADGDTLKVTDGTNIYQGALNDGKFAVANLKAGNYTYTFTAVNGSTKKGTLILSADLTVTLSGKNNSTAVNALMENIAQSYVDNSGEWVIMDMGAYANLKPDTAYKTSADAKQKYINTAITSIDKDKVGDTTAAKAILSLTAIGADVTKLYRVNDNTSFSAIDKLNQATQKTSVWNAPYTLEAYNQGEYSKTESYENALVTGLLNSQQKDGSWNEWGTIDTTANAIAGLSFYRDRTDVAAAIEKGIAYLSLKQLTDGTFNDGYGANANSTALVIVALSAAGINPDTDVRFVKNGKSALDGLLSFALENQSGFGYKDTSKINSLATEQSFRALIAATQTMKNGTAYNVYDFSGNTVEPVRATGSGTIQTPTDPTGNNITVKLTIKADNGYWLNNYSVTIPGEGATVYHAFVNACAAAGITYDGAEKGYVRFMTKSGRTLGEFDGGQNSGWMYKVNGEIPKVGLTDYSIENGDEIVWFYTNDWTTVPGAMNFKEEAAAVTTDTKTATTTSPTDVKLSEKTNADGSKESVATVTVSADNQKEILKQAKENKSKEIILQVSKDAVKDATKADVQLDKSFIESVLKDTDAKLTVKTPFGDKTYTQEELKALTAATTGKTVSLEIVKSEKTDEEFKAEQLEAAKATAAKASTKARSSKTAKGNVKVVFKPDTETQNFINEMKDMGYTVKYRFYRSTKKSSGYKAMLTKTGKTYTNTSGKKGTKYYYKVQVRVYDENGKCVAKTALKQCKYASRTWTK